MINDLPMVGIQDQKILVNKTGTPLQDLVILGGLIRISVTDGSVTARVTAPVCVVDALDHCLEKGEVTREITLVTLTLMIHQMACTRIVRAPL